LDIGCRTSEIGRSVNPAYGDPKDTVLFYRPKLK